MEGLAKRLHVSERHLHRQLITEVGAGPQALARAHRAQTARVLIETSGLAFSEVAFAAGFASIRQFNDTIQKIYAATPTELRTKHQTGASMPGEIALRLPFRRPFDGEGLLRFFGQRAVPGVELYDGATYRRSLSLPYSLGTAALSIAGDHVACVLRLEDIRDLAAAVQRCRRLLDLDADAAAIDEALGRDKTLRPLVRAVPGRRVPGAISGFELATRAVLGQQISVKGARALAAKLVAAFGKPLTSGTEGLTHLFPAPEAIADADLSMLGMPGARRSTLQHLARAVASGDIDLDAGADRAETRSKLLALPGIGPWTADLVLMRALGEPDAFLPTDLGVVHALQRLGVEGDPSELSERWRPWRSYALQHLWGSLSPKRSSSPQASERGLG